MTSDGVDDRIVDSPESNVCVSAIMRGSNKNGLSTDHLNC